MFKNYLKVAFRNLLKYKGYAIINILGLAIGLATSMLIFLWVADEYAYDGFYENGDRLYRVLKNEKYEGQTHTYPYLWGGLAELLEEEVPEVEAAIRATYNSEALLSVGDAQGFWGTGFYADPRFLSAFSVEVLEGSATSALEGRHGIVITKEMADKVFPGTSALGKTVLVNREEEYKVTAVVANTPHNSTIRYKYLLPLDVYLRDSDGEAFLDDGQYRTYVLANRSDQLEVINEKAQLVLETHDTEFEGEVFLQSIEDEYLYGTFSNTVRGGRIDYVRLFSYIAVIIIVIACINFMNLSTARSARRGREVGVRKVVGASKRMIISQFLGESFLIVCAATILAGIAVLLILPSFNDLTDKKIAIPLTDPVFYLAVLGLMLVTAILAGAYPAFFLSRFNMITVIKGGARSGKGADFMRKALVVFQFALSIALIAGTFVIQRQIHYIKNKNLGVNRENVIYFSAPENVNARFNTFKEEALRLPGVEHMTRTASLPTSIRHTTTEVSWEGKDQDADISFQYMAVTPGAIGTFGMELERGRDFDDRISDTTSVILNEKAVKTMGLKSPLGMVISFEGKDRMIVGVVKDFLSNGMSEPLQPVVIANIPEYTFVVAARISGENIEQTISSLGGVQKTFDPAYPFDYYFYGDNFDKTYKSDILIGTLINYFAAIAVFISCLGLFALASYTAEQRKKEIVIRKVLGAEVGQLVYLIGSHFALLVLIAIVVAVPLAYYRLSLWLENYHYRVDLDLIIFALAGGAALLIAALTVSYHSYKAASVNPADVLRNE